MYSSESIRIGLKYPSKIASELNRQYSHRRYGVRYYPAGMDIFEEDWDNLIILDACRFDEFQRHAEFPGRLERRTSRGSTTHQFIRGNFTDKTLLDVVYVSANGWFLTLQEEINATVHDFINVERDGVDGLTSEPSTVTETASEAAVNYPNKRLIVHYMQPHQPYLGPTGKQLEHDGALYRTIRKNNMSKDDVLDAYRENLVLALEEVERLLDTFDGKTVITADHGELLGERQHPIPVRYYGHPDGVYIEELVSVPWHVHDGGNRKEIISEQRTEGASDYQEVDVEEQLRSLGYKP